jgi:hypothetical protein
VNIFLPMQKFTSAENYLAFFCIYLEISHYIYYPAMERIGDWNPRCAGFEFCEEAQKLWQGSRDGWRCDRGNSQGKSCGQVDGELDGCGTI